MNSKEYIIYKITNTINNKVYIGQTKGSINARWYAHCRKDNPCSALKNAIAKYGKDNFTIDQIDEAFTKEELDNKEIYWISYYNSTDRNIGYNIAKGGNCTAETKRIICLDTGEKYNSIVECCNELNLKAGMVGAVCAGKKSRHKGLRFAYLDNNDNPMLDKLKQPRIIKKVICYETGIVYDSCLKASKKLGLSRNAVSQVAYGKTPTAKGYHFFFIDNDNNPIINKDMINRRHKTVKVQCVETKEVYNSFVEASKITGISKECLHQAVRKRCKANGKHWIRYEEII